MEFPAGGMVVAEFEELTISIRVDDEASGQLDRLKRNAADLGTGSQAAGFERLRGARRGQGEACGRARGCRLTMVRLTDAQLHEVRQAIGSGTSCARGS